MPTAINPLEKVILQAIKLQDCSAADLASQVGMAPTNFSLARNSKRNFPLPALLRLLELAELSPDKKIEALEWIAFRQVLKK